MSKQIPFRAYVKVDYPDDEKRFEKIRKLQRMASDLFEDLESDTDLNLAFPGGGQVRSNNDSSQPSHYEAGTAYKPQFGDDNFPAQLFVEGFYAVSTNDHAAYPNTQVLHTGSDETGRKGFNTQNLPNSSMDTHCFNLKTKIEAAATTALVGITWKIYRMEVGGVLYGNKGHHFPRS